MSTGKERDTLRLEVNDPRLVCGIIWRQEIGTCRCRIKLLGKINGSRSPSLSPTAPLSHFIEYNCSIMLARSQTRASSRLRVSCVRLPMRFRMQRTRALNIACALFPYVNNVMKLSAGVISAMQNCTIIIHIHIIIRKQ